MSYDIPFWIVFPVVIIGVLVGLLLANPFLFGFETHDQIVINLTGNQAVDADTILHESTHYFVDNDYYHFCIEYYDPDVLCKAFCGEKPN